MCVKIQGATKMDTTQNIKPIGNADRGKAESSLAGEPKTLSSKHRAIMRRLISGITLSEIAREFEITLNRLSIVTNSELFKVEKAIMEMKINELFVDNESSKVQTDMVRRRIDDESMPSLEKVIKLRDEADSEKVQQTSAFDILDRAGYAAVEKVDTTQKVEVGDGLALAIKEACKAIKGNGDASK